MDALRKDLAFAGFALQTRFNALSQGSIENRQELKELKGIHQQIIEIRRDVFSDMLSENAIDQALERRGIIAQAKGHAVEPEESLICKKAVFGLSSRRTRHCSYRISKSRDMRQCASEGP